MSDFILLDGDLAIFEPTFGPATVIVLPQPIEATGPARVNNRLACVSGDEKSVSAVGMYFTVLCPFPGTGTLTIVVLGGDQQAKTSGTGSKKLLLKGSGFTARLSVERPAMQPPVPGKPPIPDPTPIYSGSGSFIATGISVKAS